MKISATVITLNEESNLAAALDSLSFADEIVVVDSESSDRTVEIARRYTGKVISQKFLGYAQQKNFAAEQASFDWVFNLDADERVTPELAREIETLKGSEPGDAAAFEMPRKVQYLGRWIRHSGWYPDYKVRLYDRTKASWQGDYVHESVSTRGRIERLPGDILHHTVRDASDHHRRLDRYTTLAAEEVFARGKRASFVNLAFSPPATFIKTYFMKRGFLDGIPGLAIAYFAAHYVFLKYLKLWEKNRGGEK